MTRRARRAMGARVVPRRGAGARQARRATLACLLAHASIAAPHACDAAFEWRHAPPASVLPLASGDGAGALALFVSPAAVHGPRAAAVSAAQPFALAGARVGALAVVAGSRVACGIGVGWLRLDGYGEQQALAAVSFPVGPARFGLGARLLAVSIDGYEGAHAVASDVGAEIRPAGWASVGIAAGPFASAGDAGLREAVTPEVALAASAAIRPEMRLLCETREPAGHPSESTLGISWSPAAVLRCGMAVVVDPPALRTSVALAAGAFTIGASYEERPPLPPTVAASIEVRR